MNRRHFLMSMAATATGILVPDYKSVFDMGRRVVEPREPIFRRLSRACDQCEVETGARPAHIVLSEEDSVEFVRFLIDVPPGVPRSEISSGAIAFEGVLIHRGERSRVVSKSAAVVKTRIVRDEADSLPIVGLQEYRMLPPKEYEV